MELSLLQLAATTYQVVRHGRQPLDPKNSGFPTPVFYPHGNPLVAMWEYTRVRRQLDMQQPVFGSREPVWRWYTWTICIGVFGLLVAVVGHLPLIFDAVFLLVTGVGLLAVVLTSVMETVRDIRGFRAWRAELPVNEASTENQGSTQ